jgi:hypothetical protein
MQVLTRKPTPPMAPAHRYDRFCVNLRVVTVSERSLGIHERRTRLPPWSPRKIASPADDRPIAVPPGFSDVPHTQ